MSLNRKELIESFAILDLDGGGTISRMEVGRVLRELGDNPSDNELRELWASLSQCLPARVTSENKPLSENYSSLDFDQFVDAMSFGLKPTLPLDSALAMLDPGKTGKIHVGELRFVLTGGEGSDRLTDDQVDEILKELYVDENGFIETPSLFS